MPDHLHNSSSASSKSELSAFTQNYTSVFAKEHNEVCHEKGNVFHSPFGSVPKKGDKMARSNLIYLDNNPVERRLSDAAEKYRWNFLAYAVSDHPFSERLVIREASSGMKRAVKQVRIMNENGRYLSYALMKKLFSHLTHKEQLQLVDFIISTYNIIDYDGAIRYFGSYEKMLEATHSVTGSEYDLNEVFVGKNDSVYAQMTQLLLKTGRFKDIHDIFFLSREDRFHLLEFLNKKTDATLEQIAKYLHLPWTYSK
ncbi:MAG: hypothetical protein K6F21_07440 [Bacteroidales bacterium]|nr:hypothetical protein [Bacteroidales bacterium]